MRCCGAECVSAVHALLCVCCAAWAISLQDFPSFRNTYYSGVFCGVTVFTTAFAVEKQLLFYTIALPIVDTLSQFGIPTFLRYDTTASKYVLHMVVSPSPQCVHTAHQFMWHVSARHGRSIIGGRSAQTLVF
jgi:hypothetical protein